MDTISITLDIDWAPDFMIDFTADVLLKYNTAATWFVTHMSPAIERLRTYHELFELGIHPNFLHNSTHGADPTSVLCHCMELVPEARSMRTHGLVQSTQILERVLTLTPIEVDLSLFLPYTPHLVPIEYYWCNRSLIRIPYYWEDDYEFEQNVPNWRLTTKMTSGKGLRIFNFHPVHIFLNSCNMDSYQRLKEIKPIISTATQSDVDPIVHTGLGTKTMFIDLLTFLSQTQDSFRVQDITNKWQLEKQTLKKIV